jgi:hypothetical protein
LVCLNGHHCDALYADPEALEGAFEVSLGSQTDASSHALLHRGDRDWEEWHQATGLHLEVEGWSVWKSSELDSVQRVGINEELLERSEVDDRELTLQQF